MSFALALSGLACVAGSPGGGNDGTGNTTGGGTGGSTTGGGTGGSTTGGGTGGSTTGGGTGGSTSGGSGGATTGGGGKTGAGGSTTGAGGMTTTGAGGAVTGTGGTQPPPPPPFPCNIPTWPTPTGTPVSISATMKNQRHLRRQDGAAQRQRQRRLRQGLHRRRHRRAGPTNALFQLANGATIQNVIIGNHGADGIHCDGTCTIKNVWWQAVCDDAVTAAEDSSGTVTIQGGGAIGAHDKLFQDNSHGKFIIDSFYGQKLGKMYRACGQGGACGTTKGNLTLTNSIAIGVSEVVGITSGRDTATISNCASSRRRSSASPTTAATRSWLPTATTAPPASTRGTTSRS